MRISIARFFAVCGLISMPLAAQDFPNRPLKPIVPQPPGGGFDTVARQRPTSSGPCLGQSVVVENRAGHRLGTLVGTAAVARAPADRYTLLLGGLSNIALKPGLYPKLSYDPQSDFVPVGLAVKYSCTLVARKDLPQATLKENGAYIRKKQQTT